MPDKDETATQHGKDGFAEPYLATSGKLLRSQPSKHQPAPSPYRFTVSVEPDLDGVWCVYVDGIVQHGYQESMYVTEMPTEAEARSHAAQVLAALHQATMEETP